MTYSHSRERHTEGGAVPTETGPLAIGIAAPGRMACWLAIAAAAALVLGACATTALGGARVTVIAAHGECGGAGDDVVTGKAAERAAVVPIADQARLAEVYRRIDPSNGSPPVLDFKRRGALLIDMGTRPSGGYALELADPRPTLEDGTLTIHIDWRTPDPDLFATQALTRPCLLLDIPASDYRRIEVRDREGRLRGAADLR